MSLLTSLVSLWEADEASGSLLDAHGSQTLADNNSIGSATGKISGCRTYNGSNQYGSIADGTDNRTGDIDFTYTAWVNLASKPTFSPILAKRDGVAEYWLWYLQSGVDRFQWVVNENSFGEREVNANNLGSPSTGTWYFIVVEHDSVNNFISIQVNNGTKNTQAHSQGLNSSGNPFWIGRRSTYYFAGNIDQVGFWKRILTTQEKTDLYNGGNGLAYSSFGGGAVAASRLCLLGVG